MTRLDRWIPAPVWEELDAARRELDRLCAVSAAAVVAGNGIVLAGRVFGHDQAITLVTVPAGPTHSTGRRWSRAGSA